MIPKCSQMAVLTLDNLVALEATQTTNVNTDLAAVRPQTQTQPLAMALA